MIYASLDPWKYFEVQLEITGIWVESKMTEHFEFLILDRIIGRFIEDEEFCFLSNACFKSQVREQEELKARPQNQKSFTCTHSLLGCSNPSRSAGREKCVLSASLPGSSEITLVDFSGFQQDGATNVFGPQCENSQQGIKFIKINLSAFQHFLTK